MIHGTHDELHFHVDERQNEMVLVTEIGGHRDRAGPNETGRGGRRQCRREKREGRKKMEGGRKGRGQTEKRKESTCL